MQNIDVRFSASSNFGKVKADLAALEAQAASLGAVLSKSAYADPMGSVDPNRWKIAARGVHEASNAYRNAASSSGLFTTQQIRAVSETERYTKALQKQKLTLSDMRKHAGIMKQVYQDQLRYQRMTAQYWGTDSAGRAITDIAIPKNVPRDLDTAAQKMRFFSDMTKSASTQIINMGKNMQWAGRQLTVGFTYPMALVGAAAGVMAYKVSDAFGAINKVYDVSAESQRNAAARTAELGNLRTKSMDMARKAAEDYGSSITDTLQIEQQLAATGMTMNKGLLESTKNVQRISAIGDIDAKQTADMVVALGTAFKLQGAQMTDTLNYMNAASNATSLSLQDIAEATPRAASAMAALGVNAKQMTVLLVSMREAGVDAAEGANALKSATGTILAPSPAAIAFAKQIAGNKLAEGIKNLAQSSGGNLYTAMEQLFEMTKNLDKTARQQILVKLFGKYQFNRVSAMLDNLGAAFDGTQNQARKAMDLMGQSASENAKQAAASLNDMTNTASGQLKRSIEVLKADLAEMGQPFLKAATMIVKGLTGLTQGFNDLDDTTKKIIGFVAAITALAGPVVMLAGLTANLTGQFVRGFGSAIGVLARLGGAVGLVNKEEAAAMRTAEAQNRAMTEQTGRVATLADEVNVLARSFEQATAAARAYAETQGLIQPKIMQGPMTQNIPYKGSRYQLTSQEQTYYASTPRPGSNATNAARLDAARNRMAEDYMKSLNLAARDASVTEKAAAAEARARAATVERLNGANIAMGAMAGSMALMAANATVFHNETVGSVAQWGLMASLVVPALGGAVKWMGELVKGAKVMSALNIARNIAAGGEAMSALAVSMATARGAAVGFGTALNAALGPIGWIALGLTAVVGTFLAIKHHNDDLKRQQEELTKKQLAANKAMMDTSASIATNLGAAAGAYSQIVNAGGKAQTGVMSQSDVLKSYNYYKGDEGSKQLGALQGNNGQLLSMDQLMSKVRTKYIDLQVIGKDTAQQAQAEIQGMLLAAGAGAQQAAAMAEDVYKKYGDVNKIDWAKPIKDQTDALTALANEAFQTKTTWSYAGGSAVGITSFEIDDNKKKLLYQQAEKAAQIFNQALSSAANPAEAKKIIDQYMTAATSQWQTGFQAIMSSNVDGSDKVKELFAKYGVDSGTAFADAMRNSPGFKSAFEDLAVSPNVNVGLQNTMTQAQNFATEYEHAFIQPLAKGSWYLSDGVMTAATALKQLNAAGIGLSSEQAVSKLMSENAEYQKYAAILERIKEIRSHGDGGRSNQKELLDLQNQLNNSGKSLVGTINELNQAYGYKQGKTVAESLDYLMNHTAADADKAKGKVDNLKNAVAGLPSSKHIRISMDQVGGVVQQGMADTMGQMADSAMTKFNTGWDKTIAGVQASQQRAQDAMQAGQKAAQDAFDARWEKRKANLEKAYQRRIDRIKKTIDAEQNADKIRQRLFENEKARLQAIADQENANIDFNTQINEGKLDEAAKTLNDAAVKAQSSQMDAEQAAAEARTEARVKALEAKNDRLEKQRDKEVKALEAMEDRMRKHLDRVQSARAKALETEQKNYMDNLEAQRNAEQANLQHKLDLFKAFVPRNKKELDKWVHQIGLSYNDFGTNVLQKGKTWSESFGDALHDNIMIAAVKVSSDNQWKAVGKDIGNALLQGLGFKNLADFNKFVRTGKLSAGNPNGNKVTNDHETRHGGGVVGGAGGSNRGNIPNTYKGLHRSESMVRAQKGEYIVNKKASAANHGLLEAINRGSDVHGVMGGAGNFSDVTGQMMVAAASAMFTTGARKAIRRGQRKAAAVNPVMAGMFAGKAGEFAGRKFDAEQMKNAAIIASVGSGMGMSARDLEIGIMTAITESGLRNVNYGDRDSLGLFQQRPSQGWGTAAQVTDPNYASRKFFESLKGVANRGDMTPWLAAQAVQRSAFSDGSNYHAWWKAAQAIYGKGLKSTGGASGGYVPGAGGKHRPINGAVTSGLHGGSSAGNPPALDFAGPVGRPVYAVSNGVITQSRDIAGPLPSDRYRGDGPYGSFGRMIQMRTDGGAYALYGHLSRRSVNEGARVKGGSIIGYSGNTGNSSGPHLHFGATNGPSAWLRRGGKIRYDNTPVIAHRGETMLSASLTKRFEDNVRGGAGGDHFDVTIDLRGATIKEDVDIEKAVNKAIDARENKVGRKRVVK